MPASALARDPATALAFRDFDPADRDPIVRLLSGGRAADYLVRKLATFDWQFAANPHDDGRSPFLVGELDGEGAVALNGFMPARIQFHRRPVLASWSCDTYVSSKFRGRGFGGELVRRVSRAAPVMLGYGISDMSDPIFEKQGWRLHTGMHVLFCHLAERGLAGTAKNIATRIARAWRSRGDAAQAVTVETGSEPFTGELDTLWADHANGYTSAVCRDAAYLTWKYRRHPLHAYVTYVLRDAHRLSGVLIARHDPIESVIVDYCGPAEDDRVLRALADAAVEDLARRGTMRIRGETTHTPLAEAFAAAGFVPCRYRSRFRVLANDGHNDGRSDPLEGWLVMPGDSDSDLFDLFEGLSRRTRE